MPAILRHFAINADDLPRARAFYEAVFDWRFDPWGPPDFYQTRDVGDGRKGALQARRQVAGRQMPGIENTFGVEDLDAAIKAIEAHGGRVLAPPFHIETVGRLVFFEDTEGNIAGAMEYENEWRQPG